jgi:hypothetical protein
MIERLGQMMTECVLLLYRHLYDRDGADKE